MKTDSIHFKDLIISHNGDVHMTVRCDSELVTVFTKVAMSSYELGKYDMKKETEKQRVN